MERYESDLPAPRLCHVIKWPDFDGYGFNLRSDKVRGGQCIGTVDEGSPAEAAGLKDGDKIIEVNGVNVLNENHRQVVQRIKQFLSETRLLVVDKETEAYYDSREIPIHGKLSSILSLRTPLRTTSVSSQSSTDSEEIEPPKPAERKEIHSKIASTTSNSSNMKSVDEETVSPSQRSPAISARSAPSAPRLCRIIKWDQKQSFGFHLYGDNVKQEHYVGKIDPGSPAESAGLKVKDRIIEVNGSDVSNTSHKEIVLKIKANPSETTLLVVDPAANDYYKGNNIAISSSLPNVIRLQSSLPLPSDSTSVPSPVPRQMALMRPAVMLSTHSGENESHDDSDDDVHTRGSRVQQQQLRTVQSAPAYDSPPAYTQAVRPLSAVSVTTLAAARATGLDFSMTAAELRARLASRKKADPRRQRIDLLQKYKMIQTM